MAIVFINVNDVMLVLQYSYSNTPCASLAAEQCTVEQAQAWLVVLVLVSPITVSA